MDAHRVNSLLAEHGIKRVGRHYKEDHIEDEFRRFSACEPFDFTLFHDGTPEMLAEDLRNLAEEDLDALLALQPRTEEEKQDIREALSDAYKALKAALVEADMHLARTFT